LTVFHRARPHMQLPLLEIDGLKLVQSGAILRHVARTRDFSGATAVEQARCDMLACGANDLIVAFLSFMFQVTRGEDPETLLAALKTVGRCFFFFSGGLTNISTGTQGPIPKFLPRFEAQLAEDAASSPFLCGARMLYCDALLLAAVESAVEFAPDALAGHPRLTAWRAAMHAQPAVAAFLASPHRHRRPDGQSLCVGFAAACY
jgi:glutathione S-transferase